MIDLLVAILISNPLPVSIDLLVAILISNPLPVSLVILGVLCIILAIVGKVHSVDVRGRRAKLLAVFGFLLIGFAIGLSWVLAAQTTTSTPPRRVFQEQNGLVVIEAEHFIDTRDGAGEAAGASWRPIQTVGGYSGKSALQALPDEGVQPENYANGPALLYDVEFRTPGTYFVYIRGLGPDNSQQGGDEPGQNDSIHVGLDGTAVTLCEGCYGLTGFGESSFSWQGSFADQDTRIVIAQPGINTLYLWMREDGFIVDKIILSTDKDVISNGDRGAGPDESPQGR